MTSHQDSAARFEPADVPPLVPLWLGMGLAAFVVIVLVGITLGFPLADRQQYRGPLQRLPPAPRLEVAPAEMLSRYEAGKRAELERGNIEAAMRATAAQGWGPPK